MAVWVRCLGGIGFFDLNFGTTSESLNKSQVFPGLQALSMFLMFLKVHVLALNLLSFNYFFLS